ncbi:MAG: YukJ family protein [Leptolyngbyaceae cyanobacterium SL_7_1]|nr:YukJ family protein [Leptolyngbyaceae cyanobacterium SL_7_1]
MPLDHYGVLKCRALAGRVDPLTDDTPHYHVLASDGKHRYRISINVRSRSYPPDLLYVLEPQFHHPITRKLLNLEPGFHRLYYPPAGAALDYVRGGLFEPHQMQPLPFDRPGQNNDLKELVDSYIHRAIQARSATLYAFGESWGANRHLADPYFHFLPGRGIHSVHMNQGSISQFAADDGIWQDGGLLIHFPQERHWVAVFLAFQSQSFKTDDRTGLRQVDRGNRPPTPRPQLRSRSKS